MIADIKKSAEEKMKKTLETLKSDLGKIRTGRAHTGLLDHVMVDYYGTPTPINGVANLTLLCRRHHRMIHGGRFCLELSDGRAVFRRPDGSILEKHRAPP